MNEIKRFGRKLARVFFVPRRGSGVGKVRLAPFPFFFLLVLSVTSVEVRGRRAMGFLLLFLLSSAAAEALTCSCQQEECEVVNEPSCPNGLTLDLCSCCFLCARGESEPCGGPAGRCAKGLSCSNSVCIRDSSCVRERRGLSCFVSRGSCICQDSPACPSEETGLFSSEHSCRIHIGDFVRRRKLIPALVPATGAECPECVHPPCPPHSHRLPASVSEPSCCPEPGPCVCDPPTACPPRIKCPANETSVVSSRGTGKAGSCCDTFSCRSKRSCSFRGTSRAENEEWEEDCESCRCSAGVVSCRESCDPSARHEPPSHGGCLGGNGTWFPEGSEWDEEACSVCRCQGGRVRCESPLCFADCPAPIPMPDACCPVCPHDAVRGCEEIRCPHQCSHGYMEDPHGCPTCKCRGCKGLSECTKDCRGAFSLDEHGCEVCDCAGRWDSPEGSSGWALAAVASAGALAILVCLFALRSSRGSGESPEREGAEKTGSLGGEFGISSAPLISTEGV